MSEMVAAIKSFTAVHVRYALPGEDDGDTWRLATDRNRVVVLRSNETAETVHVGDKWPAGHPLVSHFPDMFQPVEARVA